MDLVLDTNGNGKYVLINLTKIHGSPTTAMELAGAILAHPEAVEFGRPGDPDEFFAIKLKDKNAPAALAAYAGGAMEDDHQYAEAVFGLAARAGRNHPHCKKPD